MGRGLEWGDKWRKGLQGRERGRAGSGWTEEATWDGGRGGAEPGGKRRGRAEIKGRESRGKVGKEEL